MYCMVTTGGRSSQSLSSDSAKRPRGVSEGRVVSPRTSEWITFEGLSNNTPGEALKPGYSVKRQFISTSFTSWKRPYRA